MVTTLFSDRIVSATDLRKNQKHWLDKAAKSPVSIAYGKYNLAILKREQVASLVKANHYLELAMRLCTSLFREQKIEVFPWADALDAKDQSDFVHEFTQCIMSAIATDAWDEVDNVLSDWRATAEMLGNKKGMAALKSKGRTRSDYIELK